MEITKINRQRRNQKRYSVFLDGEYAFSLTDETLVRLKLKEGQEIDRARIEAIAAEEERLGAVEASWKLLGFRARSTRELRERLLRKGFSPEAAEHAVRRLGELGYLDDARFARDWTNTRLGQGRGVERIRAELRKKGVDDTVIAEALAERGPSPEEEADRARQLIEKKLSRMSGLPAPAIARRLTGFLSRRGFSAGAIARALRSLYRQIDEASEEKLRYPPGDSS